jgi:hypothetical protein
MGRVCGILTQNTNFHINLINSALGNVYAYLTKYSYVTQLILTQLSGMLSHHFFLIIHRTFRICLMLCQSKHTFSP